MQKGQSAPFDIYDHRRVELLRNAVGRRGRTSRCDPPTRHWFLKSCILYDDDTMPTEIVWYGKVLPLVGLSDPSNPKVSSVLGTGFVATEGVLVTCWHVVRDALEKNQTIIAAWDRQGDGKFTRVDVSDVTQHPTGDDLATARVDLPGAGWRIPARDIILDLGTNVVSLGYPLPDVRRDPDNGLTHIVSLRLLKGYLAHIQIIERTGYPPAPSFELDMPAPRGLSGGPLLHGDWPNAAHRSCIRHKRSRKNRHIFEH